MSVREWLKRVPAKLDLSAFAVGFVLAWVLKSLLPPSEPGYPYVAIAASFALNLTCLAAALALVPVENVVGKRVVFVHLKVWIRTSVTIACAFAGLWLAPVHRESVRVFFALASLTIAQAAALFAVHAALVVFFGAPNRAPKTVCALFLCVLSTALFWSGEPIERLSKLSENGSQRSAQLADGVMKFSPPMTVASAWYQESDGARNAQSSSARRFDLVHGPLTYAVWIGSYQAIACPDILPSGGTGDFYTRREFAPGIALILLLWALPILALSDVLMWRARQTF